MLQGTKVIATGGGDELIELNHRCVASFTHQTMPSVTANGIYLQIHNRLFYN